MGVYVRGRKLYLRFQDAAGQWRNLASGFDVGEEAKAEELLQFVQAKVVDERSGDASNFGSRGEHYRPKWAPRPRLAEPCELDGWVYVVAPIPEITLRRLKVGWTTIPLETRLAAYRAIAPFAIPLAAWPAAFGAEAVAHRAISGRLLESEVFHVEDPRDAIERVAAAIAEYMVARER